MLPDSARIDRDPAAQEYTRAVFGVSVSVRYRRRPVTNFMSPAHGHAETHEWRTQRAAVQRIVQHKILSGQRQDFVQAPACVPQGIDEQPFFSAPATLTAARPPQGRAGNGACRYCRRRRDRTRLSLLEPLKVSGLKMNNCNYLREQINGAMNLMRNR
ncbi:hypothetical protein QE436_004379 [Pantoea anthophila]|nr:hypothetical protein [Pantoea anthophila]